MSAGDAGAVLGAAGLMAGAVYGLLHPRQRVQQHVTSQEAWVDVSVFMGCAREDLDPRWNWVEVRRLCDPEPRYIRGRCLHREVVPVETVVDGEVTVVARLCLTCDTQLPVEGWS